MTTSDKIRSKYPLIVKEIRLSSGEILRDKTVMICGDFLIVENGDGESPSMYNIRSIDEMRHVQEIRPTPSKTVFI